MYSVLNFSNKIIDELANIEVYIEKVLRFLN